ncbi:uncharacterized protein Z520_02910 [Fonsecaea multimorphosa CBS 102226]|uniref:Stress-response A/B barrel domain-containing protein n=1 Tax=Fonsecaea multimorphosa CBS 102226 TaxID=1442371 RepID=A0A0D2K6A0_9EURO|nr:uncharacterized protein Z520_02910 [Fonsecaea multimorphosa CBS 102226]KIY01358.1 hypothetical protein Z520_02910 [Fonsecaea multimorphosa CBS 102226]OAL28634.1 hypothetical protein AYO22_02828 [Fonsecaea multimorphosa]
MAVSDQHRVTHIVLFRYHPSIPWTELEHHFAELAKLKSTCLKPAVTGNPYMLSMSMGKNSSWENFGKGMTHCIVLEFASVEDRDFYLLEDPISGAPYTCNYIIPIEDLVVSQGGRERLGVYEYQGASGKTVSCYYCKKCTSHIYHVQQRDPSKAIVRTLLLDCGNVMGASGEIFSEGALGWVRDLRAALQA